MESIMMNHSTNNQVKRTLDATRKSEGGIRHKKRKLTPEKSKEIRLAQNRKAAKESRKRKKSMIEELQRSLVFFSKANTTLKHQNDDLMRRLMDARAQVAKIESSNASARPAAEPLPTQEAQQVPKAPEAQAQVPQTYEVSSPSKAPGTALELLSAIASPAPASVALQRTLPLMQPGATMQEMANFQQAAAAAMQAAAHGIVAYPQPVLTPSPGASKNSK